MQIRHVVAALVVIALALAPTLAQATDWEEWKFLARKRPIALLVAVPPLILTSPFMGVKWALSDHGGDDDSSDHDDDDEEHDEDDEEEYDGADEDYEDTDSDRDARSESNEDRPDVADEDRDDEDDER